MDNEDNPSRFEEKRKRQRPPGSALAEVAAEEPDKGFMAQMREWLDALIIAFVLAMFIRTFVVELFKIPSGSMSPTLLGDFVAEGNALDSQGQPQWYLLIQGPHDLIQVFRKSHDGDYRYEGMRDVHSLTLDQQNLIRRDLHLEEHRIFVNKFAYWFSKPSRGDIIVFRVPFKSEPSTYTRNGHSFPVYKYDRNKGVYVKRAVAFGGEQVEISPQDHRLHINGEVVNEPPIFQILRYTIPPGSDSYSVKVPAGQLLAFGDNSDNSYDSRMWGGVPYENLRGKAFFRYWPLKKMRFLN